MKFIRRLADHPAVVQLLIENFSVGVVDGGKTAIKITLPEPMKGEEMNTFWKTANSLESQHQSRPEQKSY